MASQLDESKLLAEAYSCLPDNDKNNLPNFQPDDLQVIQALVVQKLEDVRRKRCKFRIKHGKTFVVRDSFEKMANCIQKFIQVGDAAVQYDPGHASLPWAALRFVLQATVNEMDRNAAMREGIEEIMHLLVWARLSVQLYLKAGSVAEKELRCKFVTFYGCILSFLADACKFVHQSRPRRVATSIIFSGDEYRKHRQAIQDRKADVERIMELVPREEQIGQTESIHQGLSSLNEARLHLQRTERNSNVMLAHDVNSEQEKILDWVSRIPYRSHHAQVRKEVLIGTGKWLLSHQAYFDWKTSSSSEVLWLHGIPGSGKSTLVSIVLDCLIEESKAHSRPLPFYFYCVRSTTDRERSDPEGVLKCLLRQALGLAERRFLDQDLKRRYEKRNVDGPMSVDEAVKMIIAITSERHLTYLVVDALDECDRNVRQDLLQMFERILETSSSLVKIFISSRDDQDIKLSLDRHLGISIRARDNKRDIEFYIQHTVDQYIRDRKILPIEGVPESLKELIKRRLYEGAQGMFQWVNLQIQYLCTLLLRSEVEKRLGKLPKALGEIYQELYDHYVAKRSPEVLDLMKRTFSWLLVGQRKLKSAELVALVCSNDDSVERETLLEMCFNLVVYDKELDEFKFCHLSVQEYLEQRIEEFSMASLHDMAATTCLQIVQQRDERSYKGFDYARWYWPVHASFLGDNATAKTQQELSSFFKPNSEAFVRWANMMKDLLNYLESMGTKSLQEQMKRAISLPPHPLLVASTWGLLIQTQQMVCDIGNTDINSIKNSFGEDALQVSLSNGASSIPGYWSSSEHPDTVLQNNLEIFSILLEQGADVNADSGVQGCTPLLIASEMGQKEQVQKLLGKGADANGSRHARESPLYAASRKKHYEIMHALLDKGADVNRICSPVGNALQASSWKDSRETVQFLLENGADPNIDGRGFGTPLLGASVRGYDQIVRILLDNGADANAGGGHGSQKDIALRIASEEGHEQVALVLLNNGANANVGSDSIAKSALCAASAHGYQKIVRMLLDRGANLYTKGSYAALLIARRNGHEIIAQMLRDGGVHEDSEDNAVRDEIIAEFPPSMLREKLYYRCETD